VVVGDPPNGQKCPQQEEQIDQEFSLLGGEMVVEELERVVDGEREGTKALGQVE